MHLELIKPDPDECGKSGSRRPTDLRDALITKTMPTVPPFGDDAIWEDITSSDELVRERSWNALARKYSVMLFEAALKAGVNDDIAKDVANHALLRFFIYVDSGKEKPRNLPGLLYRIALHVAHTERNRGKRRDERDFQYFMERLDVEVVAEHEAYVDHEQDIADERLFKMIMMVEELSPKLRAVAHVLFAEIGSEISEKHATQRSEKNSPAFRKAKERVIEKLRGFLGDNGQKGVEEN